MSSLRKALLAVGAVVVLAVAFALLQPGDDDEEASTNGGVAPTTGTPATTTTPTATAPAATPEPAATIIDVRGGKPAGGVTTIEVQQGDRVRLTVTSDQPDEVHVHGYDLEKPVRPGAPASFSFTADADGIYEVELHGSDAQIASLEVQPR